ncbi:molecular chaperone DnaK, partial [Alteromonas sp. ZYF713]|nr:molecular chaperone DnaK [Alteromonas sp. ZYF713]
ANTVTSFSRLIGKMESDPIVNIEREHNFFNIVADDQGRAAIQVKINGNTTVLLPEQILAMHLHKLAQIAEYNLKMKVVDVVLSVPSYYTDRERRAFLDASRIAGLNCMRLVNETTAIGIAYGLTKKDLPAVD